MATGGDHEVGSETPFSSPTLTTIEDALNSVGWGRWQWMLLGVVSLAFVADSFEMMLLSFLGPNAKCEFGVNSHMESLLTTVVFIGMMIGSLPFGILADKIGRKKSGRDMA